MLVHPEKTLVKTILGGIFGPKPESKKKQRIKIDPN